MKLHALVLIAFVALSALLTSAHRHTDAWAPPLDAGDEIRYLPSGDSLKVLSLGFEPLMADLMWVRAVLLFGERYGRDDDGWYPWMFHMTDLATDLDPQFRSAYKMGGTMLRTDGVFVDQSNLIFQKGMHAMPERWYFPFAIGMNYHMHKDNPKLAAKYIRIAAETGQGPVYLRNLAASLLGETDQIEVAEQFLLEELRALPMGTAYDATLVKIYEIRYQLAQRDANAAIAAYRDEVGRLPKHPTDILAAGFELPTDPMTDTTYLAGLAIRPAPPERAGWVWDSDPEAPAGVVVSAGFEEVFFQISKATGYGRLGLMEGLKKEAEH